MKNILLLTVVMLIFASCSGPTDVKVHTHKPGDVYCSYNATGAGSGSFPVCMYCPLSRANCGTITSVRLLREHHWFTPNEYDEFTLVSSGVTCNVCTGDYYWEKE